MDPARFTRVDETTWRIEPQGAMRVPAIIYADENLMRDMDDKVYEQTVNVAALPGIVLLRERSLRAQRHHAAPVDSSKPAAGVTLHGAKFAETVSSLARRASERL